MRASRRAWIAGALLIVLHGVVLAAGFFAPYHYSEQNRSLPLAPPMKLRWIDADGSWQARPFVYAWVQGGGDDAAYREEVTRKFPIHFLVRGSSYSVLGLFASNRHLFGVEAPGRVFLLGTDSFGRDTFSRLLFGGQISLAAGLAGLVLSMVIALVMGGLAGYYGGWLDHLIMRFSELFLALPWLYLLFAVRAFLPLELGPWQNVVLIVGLLGVVGWARPMRLIRGVVLSAKEREYLQAATSFGASDFRLLWKHVLPQTLGVIGTQAAVLVPMYILAEVTLSFVGLGIAEPLPSWGNMLAALRQYHVLATARWMFAPGIALAIVTLLYHFLLSSIASIGGRAHSVRAHL